MKRFFMVLIICFMFVFPSYASDLIIPPAPFVDMSKYPYYAIFWNSSFNGYYIHYSSSEVSCSGDLISYNPSNNVRFFWKPKDDNYKEWIQSTSSGSDNLNLRYNTYLSGNCDVKNTSGQLIFSQSSVDKFTTHVVTKFPSYSSEWEPPSDSGGGGGGVIDLSGVLSWLKKVVDSVTSLPSKIITGVTSLLHDFFIPKEGFIEEKINYLKDKFTVSFGITPFDMSGVFSSEKAFSDITVNLYGSSSVIVNMDYVKSALTVFRKIIRGFICLLLFFYNTNQFLSLIGQSPLAIGSFISLRHSSDD